MSIKQVQNIALGIYLFSVNFEVWDPTGLGFLSIAKVAAILYLITFIGNPIPFLSNKNIKNYLQPIYLFIVILTIMNIINVNFYGSNFIEFTMLNNLLIFIVMINHERYQPGILERLFLYFAIGSITLSILYYFGIGVEYKGGRVSLFNDNENAIGIRMVFSISYIIFLTISNKIYSGKWKYLLILALPNMLKLLAETGSRTAFFALILTISFAVILYQSKKSYKKIIFTIIAIIGAFYMWTYLLDVEVLQERIASSTEEGDLGGRDELWKKIYPLIQENLIVGVGKTGYNLFALKTYGGIQSPHNVILEVLAYTGIIGLFLYLLFVFKSFFATIKYFFISKNYVYFTNYIPIFGLLISGQLLGSKLAYIVFAMSISRVFYFKK